MKPLRYLAFSDKGAALAETLAQVLGGEASRCGERETLADWTRLAFSQARGLIFVGAAGIAVRAIGTWAGPTIWPGALGPPAGPSPC